MVVETPSLKEHVVPKGVAQTHGAHITWIYPTPRECQRGFLRLKFGKISEGKNMFHHPGGDPLHLLNGGGVNPTHTFN